MPLSRSISARVCGLSFSLLACASACSSSSPTTAPSPSPSPAPELPMSKVKAPTVSLAAELKDVSAEHIAFDAASQRWVIAGPGGLAFGEGNALGKKVAAQDDVYGLAWSSDGKSLLAAPDVYDVEKGAWRPRPSLEAALVSGLDAPPPLDQLAIAAAALSADGKDLAVVTRFQPTRELGKKDSYHGPNERMILVEAATGKARGILTAGAIEVRSIAIGPRWIAAGGAPTTLWDRQTLQKTAELPTKFAARALAFSPDGKTLAALTADGDVSLWDPSSGAALGSFHAHDGDGYALAFHPTEPWLATGGQDGKLRLSLLTPSLKGTIGALLDEQTLGGWVKAVAFSPDGSKLAASTWARPPYLFVYSIQ